MSSTLRLHGEKIFSIHEGIFRGIQTHVFYDWMSSAMLWAEESENGKRRSFAFSSLKKLTLKQMTPSVMEDACRLVAELLYNNVPLDRFEKRGAFCLDPETGRLCVIPTAIKGFAQLDLNLEALGNIWYPFADMRNKVKWGPLIEFRQVHQCLLPGSFNRPRVESFLKRHGFWPRVEFELPKTVEYEAFQNKVDEGMVKLSFEDIVKQEVEEMVQELFDDDDSQDCTLNPAKLEAVCEALPKNLPEKEDSILALFDDECPQVNPRIAKVLKFQEGFGLAKDGKPNREAMMALANKTGQNLDNALGMFEDELDRLNNKMVDKDYPIVEDYTVAYRTPVLSLSSSSSSSLDTVSSSEDNDEDYLAIFLQSYNPEPDDDYLWRLVLAILASNDVKEDFSRRRFACEEAVFKGNYALAKSLSKNVWGNPRVQMSVETRRWIYQEAKKSQAVPKSILPEILMETYRRYFGESIRNLWEEAIRLKHEEQDDEVLAELSVRKKRDREEKEYLIPLGKAPKVLSAY